MPLEGLIERLFAMDDAAWARHASGWSVWTRVATLPVLLLAIWSHVWVGWWSIAPLAAVLVWIWFNPRIFAKPRSTDNWAAKATFGERVWLNRGTVPIPDRHKIVPHVLGAVAGVGAVVAVGGAALTEIWPTILGTLLVYAGKLWFLDRMVWLYEDMKDAEPRYRDWLY